MSEPKVQVVLEADVKQFAAGMQSAMGSLKGLVTAGMLTRLAKDAIEFGTAIRDMAGKAGVSTDWLQKMGFAATQTGGSLQKLGGALFELRKSISDAVGGSQSDLMAFQALGVSLEDLKSGDTEKVFERIAKAIKDSAGGLDQVNAATKVLGGGSSDLLHGMAEGYDDLTEKAKALGLVIDEQTIDAMDRLNDRLGVISLSLKSTTAWLLSNLTALHNWTALAKMAALVFNAPKRAIMAGFLGGGGLTGMMNAGGELYRMWQEGNQIVDEYMEAESAVEAAFSGSGRKPAGVSGLRRKASRGRQEDADALKRIGGYISGAGPTANLVNIQTQALQELRQIRSKLAEMARRDTSVNFTL